PRYRLAGSFGPAPALTELPLDAPLPAALGVQGAVTAPLWYGDPASAAQRQLEALGGEVAQGLTHEGRLVALLVLGPKDRAPYQAEDLTLLAAFAQVTALARESARGRQTIEVLNRDLKAKVEKVAEQQRRILALQSELRRHKRIEDRGAVACEPQPSILDPQCPIIGSSPRLRQVLHLVHK